MAELFRRQGIAQPMQNGEPQQLIFVNTCAVTRKAAAKSRHAVARLARENPDAVVIAAGCLPQLDPNSLLKIEGVDYIIGTADRFSLGWWDGKPDEARVKVGTPMKVDSVSVAGFQQRSRPFLKIQDGCDHDCTYCIIPRLRGIPRSVPREEIVSMLIGLLDAGAYEVVLTGVRIGSWGIDLGGGCNFVGLLQELTNIDRSFRLRLGSIEPWEISPDLINLIFNSAKICSHLHVPIQHTEERILKRMGRPPVDEALTLVSAARAANPDLALGVDVIAGFPGETEADFGRLREALMVLPITYLHAFGFSARPGTTASEMPDKVEESIIKERVKKLREIGSIKRAEFLKSQIGRVMEVISQKPGYQDDWVTAVSDNYIKLKIKSTDIINGKPLRSELGYDPSIGYVGVGRSSAENAR